MECTRPGMFFGTHIRTHSCLFSPTRVRLHHGEHLNERDGEEEWGKKSLGGGVVEIDDCFIAESTPFEEERRAFFYFFFFIVREEVLAAIDLDSACEQKQ